MIGERIRQARLAAGLTLDDVVERLSEFGESISKQGLSNYEKNKRTPRPSTLIKIGKALGVKPAYFMVDPGITIQWASYRCQSSLRKRNQEAIEAFAQSVAERQMYLQSILFPGEKPVFPERKSVGTGAEAEETAENLRRQWSLGNAPIDSLTQMIENHGGIVVEYPMVDVKFDGLSGWVNRQFPILVVNSGVPDDRLRFDLAHELGHLVMDCKEMIKKEEEVLAHRFAGALLAPGKAIYREFGERRRALTLQELGLLKKKYGLSMQAFLYRIRDLGIISESALRDACKAFIQQGWKKREPVEYRGDEEPTRLRQMVLRALAEGIITPEKAEELCPGCAKEAYPPEEPEPRPYSSPSELFRLPKARRKAILAKAAAMAEEEYRTNRELTDFEAFGEDDLHD